MKVPRVLVLALFFVWSIQVFSTADLPIPTAEKLPRYRGFNLLEKFVKGMGDNGPFKEADFQLISEWGFNFVRLPMDYRIWILDGDWTKFDEEQFKQIDQAVEYSKKYNVHICINFHRAPGYTVASPPEPTNLWTDSETQRICAMHWAYFAKRYKDVPNKYLSFNLVNEPGEVASADYFKVAKMLIDAIRAEDPERLIISDGLDGGLSPSAELCSLNIAQAMRGYQPFGLTHYKANWVDGSDRWAVPQWPVPLSVGGYLFGPSKKELRSPILIQAEIDCPMQMALHIGMVSAEAELTMWDDDQKIFSQAFHPGPGDGPWKQSIYKERWNVYQNLYDFDSPVELSAGTHTLRIENTTGDWLTLTQITFQTRGGLACVYPVTPQWGQTNEPLLFSFKNGSGRFTAEKSMDRQWLWQEHVQPWVMLSQSGTGVMVGEWGAYNKTPHDVTLRWMEDCLKNYQQAGFGWALWNFRGPFGVLDSGRDDVQYEDFRGHKLDRKMLELLQKY